MVQRRGCYHFLPLTIKIRLASTVSTLALVKAWQERKGWGRGRGGRVEWKRVGVGEGAPPPTPHPKPCLRVCHVNYGDPTVPFTGYSGLKQIHTPSSSTHIHTFLFLAPTLEPAIVTSSIILYLSTTCWHCFSDSALPNFFIFIHVLKSQTCCADFSHDSFNN